jgi:hypothetical protein
MLITNAVRTSNPTCNYVHEKVKNRYNFRSACYHSVQKHFILPVSYANTYNLKYEPVTSSA